MEGKTKFNNRLWNARRKIGLEQKQVANLLGHKTSDQISRYERGTRLPNFKTALKLAIIYGTSLQELFPEHYEQYRKEVQAKAEAYVASLSTGMSNGVTNNIEITEPTSDSISARESSQDSPLCHYARLLENPLPEQRELAAVKKHVTKLIRTMTHL
ncbi:MAG: helix-turn-helix domain-containing protein [Acidobacteriota bacterium]|nr:helix-turn-helix domain-containing protein [Acidobacteriota bacterium]